jgi:hypothetical protein
MLHPARDCGVLDAERAIPMYLRALKRLVDYERRIRKEDKAKKGEPIERKSK